MKFMDLRDVMTVDAIHGRVVVYLSFIIAFKPIIRRHSLCGRRRRGRRC